jgi:predicted Zn-ribbon and HTH transcriptional regulator
LRRDRERGPPSRRRPRSAPSAEPEPAAATVRRQILARLEAGAVAFEELCRELRLAPRALEIDLRHLERSLRADGRRLEVEPARCMECRFVFRGREQKHFHAPSRCPKCRSERIEEPRFSIRSP